MCRQFKFLCLSHCVCCPKVNLDLQHLNWIWLVASVIDISLRLILSFLDIQSSDWKMFKCRDYQETRVTPFTRSEKNSLISRLSAHRDASLTVCVFLSTAVINNPQLQSEGRIRPRCHEQNHKLHFSPEFHTRQPCLFCESKTKIKPGWWIFYWGLSNNPSRLTFIAAKPPDAAEGGEEPMKRLFPPQTDLWVFAFHPSEDAASCKRQSKSVKLLWLLSLWSAIDAAAFSLHRV